MEDSKALYQVIDILRKRFSLILIIGIIVSCLFMGVKYFSKSSYTLAPSDDILIGKTLRIDDYKDRYDELHYDRYLQSPSFLKSFVDATKDRYNYNKIAPGWNKKTISQKIEWLNKHIIVSYYGAGRMEIQLSIKRSDPVDLAYIEENGSQYIDSFIDFANLSDPFGDYTVVSSIDYIPQEQVISSNKVIIKYGAIGFVLGVVGMATVILVWNMGKCYHGKH